MATPVISPGISTSAQPRPSTPTSESFDRQLGQAQGGLPAQGELPTQGGPTVPGGGVDQAATEAGDGGALDEAAFQAQIFSSFAGDLDEATAARLSAWLPDVLNGGKKKQKGALEDLSKQEAADLDALVEAHDLKGGFKKVKDRDGLGEIIEKLEHKANRNRFETLTRAYGEHALKASTPALAPSVSYETGSTIEATRQQVFDQFTEGLDAETRARLETWLPDALDDPSDFKEKKKAGFFKIDVLDVEKGDRRDLEALADLHGIDDKNGYDLLKKVSLAFKRDEALATTGQLPSVVDMMLVKDHGEGGSGAAAEIDLGDGDLKKALAEYEKSAFTALDSWLPDALAGRGGVPSDDPEAMALLQRFAERMGFKGDAPATTEQALEFLKDSRAFNQALHPGRTGEDRSFLLFSDSFLDSTLKYGARNGAVSQEMVLDAANVAEMLLGPDDGTDAPGELQMAGLQAAILHRTDEKLVRPQEVMAASGYIAKAETLTEQKSRLVESLLAFHVREEIGTPPMTAQQWATSYEEVHPELLDELGGRVFNSPTSEKMQIITQHLGVPGDHKFMIDKKRKIKIENDDLGNVENFDMKKKKKKWYKKLIDVAVPVIGTVLTFVPGAQAVGMGINAAYAAYKGAEAIKHGDLAGGLLGIAGAIPGGGLVARGAQIASGALRTVRAIEAKDWMGALSGGLGTMSMASGGRGFQTAATGVNTAQGIKDGDLLAAGAGMAGLAGDASAYGGSGAGTQFAFQGLEQGLNLADAIDDKNYAGIGGAASGLINTGGAYHEYREEQAKLPPEDGVGGGPNVGSAPAARGEPALDADGKPIILKAGYPDQTVVQARSIEVAGADTLSQIAQRHGTTVEALMIANSEIADPNRIHAGQQLTLPKGVQPVVVDQQGRLQDFADSQGGPSHLPSPPRPDLQDQPSLSPAEGTAAMADAEFGVALEVYQREFGEAIDQELSSIDQQITDIDRQLDDGVNHAPVEYHLKNERLKLMAERRNVQTIADDPNAAFEALKARNEGGWTASDVGHMALDIIGLAPVVGEWADGLNAAWYFAEGDVFNGTLSAGAVVPGAGIGATLGKWGAKAQKTLDRMYEAAPAAKAEIDELAQELAQKFDGSVADAPLKSRERAMEKSVNNYHGKPQRLTDIARNTIVTSGDNVDAVVAELRARGAKVKEFKPESSALGYSGVNAVIETKAGIKAEIQVNTPEMIYAKEPEGIARSILGDHAYDDIASKTGMPGGMGHKIYEEWRQLPDEGTQYGRELAEKSREYYRNFQK